MTFERVAGADLDLEPALAPISIGAVGAVGPLFSHTRLQVPCTGYDYLPNRTQSDPSGLGNVPYRTSNGTKKLLLANSS